MRPSSRMMIAAAVAVVGLLAPAAGHASFPPECLPAAGDRVKCVFTQWGESQFVVPHDVDSITAKVVGAPGEGVFFNRVGLGAKAIGDFAVSPGQKLYVEVNVGGGAAGGQQSGQPMAGPGGGESDVRLCSTVGPCTVTGLSTLTSRLLVAGGGGGEAADGAGGGNAGIPSPATNGGDGTSRFIGQNAKGGTGASGLGPGHGGAGCPGLPTGPPGAGGAAGGGAGGAGGGSNATVGGGGGGGGWFGGGGGGGCATRLDPSGGGGGGGTSHAASAVSGATFSKDPGPQPYVTLTYAIIKTFSYTGKIQTFTVPNGVTNLQLTVRGAGGRSGIGSSGVAAGTGGPGAQITGTVAVTPGTVLHLGVGQGGGTGGATGCGSQGGSGGHGLSGYGGGSGGAASLCIAGGGGGGGAASFVRIGSNAEALVTAAGGGGGGGGGGIVGYSGGSGGSAGKAGGGGDGSGAGHGSGGKQGESSSALGGSGTGAGSGTSAGGGGGGGAGARGGTGGTAGGAGAGGGGGGGAGSNHVSGSLTDPVVSASPSGAGADGLIVIAYTQGLPGRSVARPSATTESSSAVGSHCATLHGLVKPDGAPTSFYFQYGHTKRYGRRTNTSQSKRARSVALRICGLAANTTYHYRLVAYNIDGTSHGLDRTIQTRRVRPPRFTG